MIFHDFPSHGHASGGEVLAEQMQDTHLATSPGDDSDDRCPIFRGDLTGVGNCPILGILDIAL